MEDVVAIVGAGPAGLAAADAAREAGAEVVVFDAMRSAGRKFLVAGKGGLNLTHSEPLDAFVARYREAAPRLEPFLRAFPPDALRALAESLGQPTFVGSSGRVFPKAKLAAPMLRAWIGKLKRSGVRFCMRARFRGFEDVAPPEWLPRDRAGVPAPTSPPEIALIFEDIAHGAKICMRARAAVLALGGGSWPKTGSDGAWVAPLRAAGVDVADLAPSNAGFEIAALPPELDGRALKNVALSFGGERAAGDVTITRYGLEGTPVYRLSPLVRAAPPPATIALDLKPDLDEAAIARRLAAGARGAGDPSHGRATEGRSPTERGSGGAKKSLSTRLSALKLDATARALLRLAPRATEPAEVARLVKSLPLTVTALRPLAEAISSAGGVRWSALDDALMLRVRPGVFVAGEMIDWEAPTGGYLLQACVSTGRAAGLAAAKWRHPP